MSNRKFLLLLVGLTLFMRYSEVESSYLAAPRLHFRGKFRADVTSQNNCPCNYHIDCGLDPSTTWNSKGSNEWELIETYITSVIDERGREIRDSPLVGGQVFSSDSGPMAKVVDLDPTLMITSLFGAVLTIQVNGETIVRGNWTAFVISNEMWSRVQCGRDHLSGDAVFSSTGTSTITNIRCFSEDDDLNLCRLWNTRTLSVSITLGSFSVEEIMTGTLVGTIGFARPGEPLNIGGERKLIPSGIPLTLCQNDKPIQSSEAINFAPFLYDGNRGMVVIDFSNTFPTDAGYNTLDIGCLWLGVLNNGIIASFGNAIPYLDPAVWNNGGIIEISVPIELQGLVQESPIVIFSTDDDDITNSLMFNPFLNTQCSHKKTARVLLKEVRYFIRPTGIITHRIEYGNKQNCFRNISFLVTKYGRPSPNTLVTVTPDRVPLIGGVVTLQSYQLTDNDGLVTYQFIANKSIPFPRQHNTYPCDTCDGPLRPVPYSPGVSNGTGYYELPIEGLIYTFIYCVLAKGISDQSCDSHNHQIAFKAYPTINYQRPFTWEDHVGPIFKQYHHMYDYMRAIIDMSSYDQMTQPNTLKFLKLSMNRDINDAGYMPVTRDLSESTMTMILEWLDNPCYSKEECINIICKFQSSGIRYMSEDKYERCSLSTISDRNEPQIYFQEIFTISANHSAVAQSLRPLYGYGSEQDLVFSQTNSFSVCNVYNLRQQLQFAVQIEYSVLPLYLTSLYSIMDNCNVEAHKLIRNIIVQEMLHFTQAANILIAVGGRVIIDSMKTVPHFPMTGLPGGVLPNLTLNLEKFSLKHVYENFMAIEVPGFTTVPKPLEHLNTVGQFYNEINDCLLTLGDDVFINPRIENQIKWPWEPADGVGTLHIVHDIPSAMKAINEIIEQGEGARTSSPIASSTRQYAHFFQFEEIFCENELVQLPEGGYAYSGQSIPYNSNGVWNMKINLSPNDIDKDTTCYSQARAFHSVHRTFLKSLQYMFDGHPEKMEEVLQQMQMLKAHAKLAIETPFNTTQSRYPNPGELTCGPIWDYYWQE